MESSESTNDLWNILQVVDHWIIEIRQITKGIWQRDIVKYY